MQGIKITGTGSFLPEATVTNDDFAQIVDTSHEWIYSRTGIAQRRIATDEPTWYLGAKAAEKALKAAKCAPDDIDMIVVSTMSADFSCPSTAAMIQRYLGTRDAIVTDISVACTGIAFSLDMARRYLYSGDVDRVLLVGAETASQLLDFSERSVSVLFGDGAGACVVERGDGIFGSVIHCDATGAGYVYARNARRAHPFGGKVDTSRYDPFPAVADHAMRMNGREVYKFAVRALPQAVESACEKVGIAVRDLAMVIPHQANARILQAAAEKMGIDEEKMFVNVENYANTSGATIAIGLDECIRSDRIKRGDTVCLAGFGSGLLCGAVVFTY
jgi:3-oxoacyl-(acyl-carrier-protein) synthase III